MAFPNIDKAVFAWLREQRANKVPLSGKVPQQEALNFTCMLDVVRRERKKKKMCTEGKFARNVLDAFDMIRSFLGAHDYSVAMDYFLQCESRALKLLQGKARQSKLTDFWE